MLNITYVMQKARVNVNQKIKPVARRTRSTARTELQREAWVDAARQILIETGITGISLRKLSESLNATTGAFYWQYKNLEELHEDLRQDWATRNTTPFTAAIEGAKPDGMSQYLAYVRVLVLESDYDPRYDNAIREWAHASPRTAEVLREVELARIDQLKRVFLKMGFDPKPAEIRARVTYFHQTGYNFMQITETVEERLSNIPFYAEVLTDNRSLLMCKSPEQVRECLLKGVVQP